MREGNLPLRTVLQNFTNNLDSLEASNEIKAELHENEFQDLKKFTEDLKGNRDYSTNEGERDCNRRKNRYKDILPYDYTRVVLQDIPGVPGSDYVNANYIRGASGSRAYIASQGPLPHTVTEFWRMVVECDVQVIVMASNETEGGKHKCECYWVTSQGEEKQFGNVQVTYIKSRQVCPDFLVRTFKIKYCTEKNKKEERTICQFHYILWPDHGIPDTVRPLLDMVRLVRDCQASETLPVLVHCSAGCGRTGTICAIDYVWGLLRTGKLNQNLDLFGLVKEMRKQRVAMVQTREQYALLHQAVKELFRERRKLIDAHPYENISTDGKPLIPTEKESDYEELFVSSEKQDKSTKANGVNVVDKIQASGNSRGLIRRSASTSSLDRFNLLKPNYKFETKNIVPTASMYQSMPNEYPNSNDNHSTTKNHNTISRNALQYLENVPERKKYSKPSKMEKDAENFAQLAKEKVLMEKHSRDISNFTKKPFNDQRSVALSDRPAPHISRTPSPSGIYRQSVDSSDGSRAAVKETLPENQSKGSDISNGANIQKLKEVFETSLVGSRPGRLTRSASSVSIRPNFSVANSRDLVDAKKFSPNSISTNSQDRRLFICPPPPTDPIPEKWKMKRSLTAISFVTSKKCSDSNSVIKSGNDSISRHDERPVLPIKKSKSFRWSRQEPDGSGVIARNPIGGRIQRSNVSKTDHDTNSDVPAVKERLKLSVYQGSPDISSSASSSATDIRTIADNKPIVPPKKAIGERYKSFMTQILPTSTKSQHASASSEDKQGFVRKNQPLPTEKHGQASVGTQMYPNEFPLKIKQSHAEDCTDHGSEKIKFRKNQPNTYINAKLRKTTGEEDHYSYVPLPSKRNGRTQNPYVNYNVLSLDQRTSDVSKSDTKKGEIKVASDMKLNTDCVNMPQNSAALQSKKPSTADYDFVDFGEAVSLSNQNVIETVNYELVNTKPNHKNGKEQKDFYLNTDLDTIAKQVYKDCEAYLLSRDNRSPVPSLLPKHSPSESEITSNVDDQSEPLNESINPSELNHVINKIAVAPQGLRNRERRNSYRQAVSSAHTGCSRPAENRRGKNINQYERIWFENGEKKTHVRDRRFQEYDTPATHPPDFSLNINKDMNISTKDSLFKDKLEEIHIMMNDIERKHLQYLPDLSEEEMSSKHSSSTSSLVSRSGQSSRSSERAEPVYVNTPAISKAPTYLSPDEPQLGQFSGFRKTRAELDTRAIGGASHYGTLATTTSYPYRPTRAPQYGLSSGPSMASSMNPYTATLPLRSATIPPENNVLYTRSAYRKPTTQNRNRAKSPHHPLHVYQSSTKEGGLAAKSPPVLHQKGQAGKKRDPMKRMDQPIKPSEVHRKRQQLNSKESLFRPKELPFLPHNALQHSASTPHFHSYLQKPTKQSELEPKDAPKMSSELSAGAIAQKILRKKSPKELNCVSSTALSDSSLEDSSADDDGVFVKFAPANILKKLRTAQAGSSKISGKEEPPCSVDYQPVAEIEVSPSASPKTFTKAFDKFKTGSKNVAANFKSYIKGDKPSDEDSASKSENCSTYNVQSYEDAKKFSYPLPLPNRPPGSREIRPSFVPNAAPFRKKSKQQYL